MHIMVTIQFGTESHGCRPENKNRKMKEILQKRWNDEFFSRLHDEEAQTEKFISDTTADETRGTTGSSDFAFRTLLVRDRLKIPLSNKMKKALNKYRTGVELPQLNKYCTGEELPQLVSTSSIYVFQIEAHSI